MRILPAVLLLSACSRAVTVAPTTISPIAGLRVSIDSMIDNERFRNAHWGILIVDPAAADTLYSRNAGKLFMPASNQKLITGAVGLAQLGADFRFSTDFVARGPVRDGIIEGDLAVVGRGDPTISDRVHGQAMLGLLAIADSLVARGIRRIDGRLVSGADTFTDAPLGFGWAWDDLDYAYSAGVDELFLNDGFATLHVRAGDRPGDVPHVTVGPARNYPAVRVLARTTAPVLPAVRPRLSATFAGGDTLHLTGEIAVGDTARVNVAYRDPSGAYLAALREALGERGIDVRNTDLPAVNADTLFATHSATLAEILPHMQKPSQNQIAEILFKTIALNATGIGTADSARRVIERQLSAWGADTAGHAVRDGSGLSRHDYLTPETIIRVLDAMRRAQTFGVFYNSLPIAGVDGTIRSRFKGTIAEGNLRAKTGFVDKARSLSGYVSTADGRLLLFSMLANNWTVPVRDVERVQDEIGARLAAMRLGRRPTTAGMPPP